MDELERADGMEVLMSREAVLAAIVVEMSVFASADAS